VGNLVNASGVEPEETGRELDGVSEVSLHLRLHCVTNNTLLVLVSDYNTAKIKEVRKVKR